MMLNDKKPLLLKDISGIRQFLDAFQDLPHKPMVGLGPSGDTLFIKGFPLPDKYYPHESVDMVLLVHEYPVSPPKGLYLMGTPENMPIIAKLQATFNVFLGSGFHGAPSVANYHWLCVGYLNGWKFNARDIRRGDSITKMLIGFWRLMEG